MNKGWFKKVSLVLMLALSLGTVACGSGQESQDEEAIENFVDGQNARDEDEGSVTCFGDSGCITSTDDFVSVNTGFDGPTFASDF